MKSSGGDFQYRLCHLEAVVLVELFLQMISSALKKLLQRMSLELTNSSRLHHLEEVFSRDIS